MSTHQVRVAIALLLGIGSITAGLLTWRAGQIGSSAAFEDRSSVSQEVASAQRRIDVTTQLAAAGADYVRYLADRAEADDASAREVEISSVADAESDATDYGDELRQAAEQRAEVVELFPASIGQEMGFALDLRSAALIEEAENDLLTGGNLDPGGAADEADAIRGRVRGLIWWTLVVLVSVACFTVAQVATTRSVRRGSLAVGSAIYGIGVIGALSSDFFA